MAVEYSSISLGAVIADIVTALNSKSLITEIKYQTTEYLIFTTPLLSASKVVKIRYNTSYGLQMYVGSSWTSSSTIADSQQFGDCGMGPMVTIHLLADTDFFMLLGTATDADIYSIIQYVGALENGDELVFGCCGDNDSNSIEDARGINLTDAVNVKPITWNTGFSSVSGKIITSDLMWCNSASGVLEENVDTTPANTVGVKLSSAKTAKDVVTVVAGSYVLTPGIGYIEGQVLAVKTSLFIDLT